MKWHSNSSIIIGSLIGIFMYLAVEIFSSLITDSKLLKNMITSIPGIILCVAIAKKGKWFSISAKNRIPKCVLIAPLVVFVLVNPIGKPVSSYPGHVEFITAVLICIFIGLGEELFFRGYLFELFRGWSEKAAVLLPSLVFGLFHFSQGIAGICVTFIVGLSFGMARVAGLSLWVLILLHSIVDLPAQLPHKVLDNYGFFALFAIVLTVAIGIWYSRVPSSRISKSVEALPEGD